MPSVQISKLLDERILYTSHRKDSCSDAEFKTRYEDAIIERFNALNSIEPIYLYTIRNPDGAAAKLLVASKECIPDIIDSIEKPLCFSKDEEWRYKEWKSYESFGGPIIVPCPPQDFTQSVDMSFKYIASSYQKAQDYPGVHSIAFLLQIDEYETYLCVRYRFYAFSADPCNV